MAKKYIELGQAKRALSDEAWNNPYFRQEEYAINVLNKLPAADVAEIQHAHWEIKFKWEPLAWDTDPLDWDRYDEKTHSEEVDYYACSKCGYDGGSWKPSWKYCPSCGARMDEEVNE